MHKPKIAILGAGPAGVGAAYYLRRSDLAAVTLLEQRDAVGGNAGSFEVGGHRLDYGSHRLHPATDPAILEDIRSLLGEDLLTRPRHGRILLRGKWIHFPLKPIDLLLRLDRKFAVGTMGDMLRGVLKSSDANGDSFAAVLREKLGKTVCQDFYFPYARKIWGRDPEELSAVQARRRVSANSFAKLLRKLFSHLPGVPRSSTSGMFYYPRRGFGQISESYAAAAAECGADVRLGWSVNKLDTSEQNLCRVTANKGSEEFHLDADYVWSTLPISVLAKITTPAPPEEVIESARLLEFRAMVLVYLELPVDRFTEYDAHYFPDSHVAITRLSEPKNYAARNEPTERTTLCAELPCSVGDEIWSMTDAKLAEYVAADLATAGIPLPASPVSVTTRRLPQAYPIYIQGYDKYFQTLDNWVNRQQRVLSFGRQGLFAHDNTHHALAMAHAAVDCLNNGAFDDEKWSGYRKVFETHVVED